MAITFRIEPDGLQVNVMKRAKIAEASVVLRDELQELLDGGTVVLSAQARGTNATAVGHVVNHLQYGFAYAQDRAYDVKSVAQLCNVIVQYECDPAAFEGLWDRMPQSFSLDKGGEKRCWRRKIPTKETRTAAHLAISALVLGRQEELAKELGVVVWALDAELDTTIPELQNLHAMRLEEQKDIFDDLSHHLFRLYADRNDQRTIRLADKIRQDVRRMNLPDLADTWEHNCTVHTDIKEFNPYKLIRRYEDAIIPPETKAGPDGSSATEDFVPEGSRSFPIDLGELRQVVGQGIGSFVKRKSVADNGATIIRGIFDAVEARVRTRQMERAAQLIQRRAVIIAGWRDELDNPSTRRWSGTNGNGLHRRGDSAVSVSQPRSMSWGANGHQTVNNGERAPRPKETSRAMDVPQSESLYRDQWLEMRNGGFKGKAKEQPQAVELSSVSTRRSRVSVGRRTWDVADQNNHNGVGNLGWLQVDFGNGEDSWRHGDDNRHLRGYRV